MPELPEVETTVRFLRKKIIGFSIIDVWSDAHFLIKKPLGFNNFKKSLRGKKILKITRRGKNILIFLSGKKILLIHQGIAGHLLWGKWSLTDKKWQSLIGGVRAEDPKNQSLHLIFFLNNGWQIGLSDPRKFSKTEFWDKKELLNSKKIKDLGPEPLEKNFTFGKFNKCLKNKRGTIRKCLMNQKIIAGIGNIYSSEILWQAQIHPMKKVVCLEKAELKNIFFQMKKILKEAISLHGASMSDFRKPDGSKGDFYLKRRVYQREGEKCQKCGTTIKRIKADQRSVYFCPQCQKI